MVHDYQLTTIGNALKYYGYSFNSLDPEELAKAEKLLLKVKPHLFAITSDYQPAMRNGDAWMTRVLDRRRGAAPPRHARDAVRARQGRRRDLERLLCRPEGGAEPQGRLRAASTSCSTPAVNAKEVHGARLSDRPMRASRSCCRKEILENPILYPARTC